MRSLLRSLILLFFVAFPTFLNGQILYSPYSTVSVQVDGYIQAGEWVGSNRYDISDVQGHLGSPTPAGSVYFLTKHDSSFLSWGIDVLGDSTRTPGDSVSPFLDENFNHQWEGDSSEGNYTFKFFGADSITYIFWLDTLTHFRMPGPVPPPALVASSMTSGRLQFEAAIPITSAPFPRYFIQANGGGDTLGFFILASFRKNKGDVNGWWPPSTNGYNNPGDYGGIILGGPSGVEQGLPSSTPLTFRLRICPNPFSNRVTLTIEDSDALAEGCLKLYNVQGHLVRNLSPQVKVTSLRTFSWDGRSDIGVAVPPGIYFAEFVSGASRTIQRLILVR